MSKPRFSAPLVVLTALLFLLVLFAGTVQANAVVASASGNSQFEIHDMFGFELIDVRTFAFNAQKRADGSVTGHYEHRSFDDGHQFYVRGPLTCLNVDGGRAWVGGIIEDSSEPFLVGLEMWFQVMDNGQGAGDAADWSTLVGASPEEGSAQEYCDDAPEVNFPFNIEHGDIRVDG